MGNENLSPVGFTKKILDLRRACYNRCKKQKTGMSTRLILWTNKLYKTHVTHKDLAYKLKYYNAALYKSVKEILEINKSERHLRGGEATRKKYLKKRNPEVEQPIN